MGSVVVFLRKLGVNARFVRLAWVVVTVLGLASSTALAQANQGVIVEVRTIYPSEWGVPNRGGLTYSANLNQFFLLKQGRSDQAVAGGATLVTFTPYEELVDVLGLDFSLDEATNVAFDEHNNRLLVLTGRPVELVQIQIGREGKPDPTSLTRFDMAGLGLQNAQGLAVDGQDPALLILDSPARQVVRVPLTAAGLELAAVVRIELAPLGLTRLRGLAVNPTNQHLYVMGGAAQKLYELTAAGQRVQLFDPATLGLVAPRALVFAPSADLTDAPDIFHLFLLDGKQEADQVVSISDPLQSWMGRVISQIYFTLISPSNHDRVAGEADGDTATAQKKPRTGAMIEVVLEQAGQVLHAASTNATPLFLVQTVNTAAFSPPSPDPAGITYIPITGMLWVSDSEVEERPDLFTGINLFGVTLAGGLTETKTTTPFSNEPTDAAYNPNNGHIFYSDDNARKIFEVNPGGDGIHGTGDDIVTSFSTSAFSSMDPEGLTYAAVSGALFISDSANHEVYRVDAGANGIFDGVLTSGGDDVVTNFDTASFNLYAPEGIHFDAASGNLILVGKADTLIYEVSTAGSLVQTFDIAAAHPRHLAGVVMAPSRTNPALTNYYIVDRGADNNIDPHENDGKMYEFTLDASAPTVTPLPTSTLPPSPTAAPPTNTPAATIVPPTATPIGPSENRLVYLPLVVR